MKNKILKILILSLIISAIIGIAIILFGSWNELESKIFLTTLTIFGFSIPSLCCSNLYKIKNLTIFSKVGISTCILSGIIILFLIWYPIHFWIESNVWNLFLTLCILSISFAHISLILTINSKYKQIKNVKYVTILLAVISDIIYLILIWSDFNFINWKVVLILLILVCLGTIILPILNKLYRDDKDNKFLL